MYAHKSKGRFSSPRMPSHQPQKDADKSRLARFSALSAVHPAEMDDGYQYRCSYTDIAEDFGRLQAADDTEISHVQGTADANDTFALNSGALSVTTNRAADASYYLEDGSVKIEATNGVVISAQASFAARNTVRTVSFKYNHNGLRTQKTVVENGITTTYDYTLHGKLITHLTKRVVNGQGTETGREALHFFYDSQSRPAFVKYGDAMYRYVHNLQGDIVAILDATGSAVVEYKYDAWGKPIGNLPESGVGKINPFRYRGYVYDEETELYYLKSRYYDILNNRFITSDAVIGGKSLFAHNLYCYCKNSPLCYRDADGATLENSIMIDSNSRDHVQFCIIDNSVYIVAYVELKGDGVDVVCGDTGKTYGELFVEGIEEYWSGTFSNVFNVEANVYMNVVDCTGLDSGKIRTVPVTINNSMGVSHATLPNLFLTIYKWRTSKPSSVTMYIGDSRNNYTYSGQDFKYVSAHEFGHVMGVADVYNTKLAGTVTSIMNVFGTRVQSIDIEKVLTAFSTGKWQKWK